MKNGRLIAPIWLANGEVSADGMTRRHMPSVCGCIYSDDHGITWHAGLLADGLKDGNETSVAQLPDGRLLFNFRNRHEDYHRRLGLSRDGETLEKMWMADALQDPMCFGGMAAGKLGVLFGNCDSSEKRVNCAVKYTRDAGETWEKIWDVDEISGYVDVAYHQNRVYVFYEHHSYEERNILELVLKISAPIEL